MCENGLAAGSGVGVIRSADGNAIEYYGYAQSYMAYDIAALQAIYGVNWSTNSGDTTYTWSETTGEMFINGVGQGAPGSNRILQTIWDGGGTDTIDLSGYSMAQLLTLEAGEFSNVGGYVGNFSIAIGAVIENAIGGSGNDTITGNSADNQITGGGGTDHFVMGIDRSAATITARATR